MVFRDSSVHILWLYAIFFYSMILRDPFSPFLWSYAINLFLFYCITLCDLFFLHASVWLIFLFYCSTRLILQCYLVLRDFIPVYYGLVRLILFSIILRDYLLLLHESVRLILFFYISTRLIFQYYLFLRDHLSLHCGSVGYTLSYFLVMCDSPFPIRYGPTRATHLFLFCGPTRFSLFYLINMRLICDEYAIDLCNPTFLSLHSILQDIPQVYFFFLKLSNILLLSML